jgi:hypothetical protein
VTTEEFEKAVKEMRTAQIQFFEASHGSLAKRLAYQTSRKWEKVVDLYLKRKDPNLFEEINNGG